MSVPPWWSCDVNVRRSWRTAALYCRIITTTGNVIIPLRSLLLIFFPEPLGLDVCWTVVGYWRGLRFQLEDWNKRILERKENKLSEWKQNSSSLVCVGLGCVSPWRWARRWLSDLDNLFPAEQQALTGLHGDGWAWGAWLALRGLCCLRCSSPGRKNAERDTTGKKRENVIVKSLSGVWLQALGQKLKWKLI